MATFSGSATGSNGSRINVWIDINETQVEVPNNRSYVTADFYAQVKSGQSSSTYDNQAPVNFYINGGHVLGTTMAIDFRSNNLNHLAHWEGWVGHDANGNGTLTASGNFSLASSYVSGGSCSGALGLTNIWSGIGSPSGATLKNISAASMQFTFNGASGGVNNPVSRYDAYIQYSDNEGASWSGYDSWGFGSVGSGFSIDISGHPGGRLFKGHVYAIGSRGDVTNSGDSNLVRKPWTVPGIPTSLGMTMIPASRAIRLSWAKGSAGSDNPINGHEVRYSFSDDNANWSAETSVAVGANTLSYDIPSEAIPTTAKHVRFRVGSKSAQSGVQYSGYASTVYTSPSVPTSLGLNLNTFETALRLTWTRGANGTNNAITGQDLRYCTSDDGVNWSADTSVALGANDTYYDIPTSTIAGWSRGKYVKYRVGVISKYTNTVYSGYSGSVRKNRIPNTPVGVPTTNKMVYTPSESIVLSFTPPNPRDPDTGLTGDIAGYEAKMQSPDGVDYQNGVIIGTNASASATTITIPTTDWSPGLQWKFLIRGYDSYGVRGNWSAASEVVMMGIPMKVSVGGLLKTAAEHNVLVNGELKQVSDIKILVNGALKNLTA